MDSYEKQEKERKSRFSVENDLTKLLEQSQSNATKRNTKWVVKLFQGKKPLLCFEINELNKQKLSEIDLFGKKNSFLNVKIIVYTDWCQERNITTPLLKINSKELDQNLARFYEEARTKKDEEYSRSTLLGFSQFHWTTPKRQRCYSENIKKPSISKQQQNSRRQAQNQPPRWQRKYST